MEKIGLPPTPVTLGSVLETFALCEEIECKFLLKCMVFDVLLVACDSLQLFKLVKYYEMIEK
jgi:hypothetical protein